MMIDFELYFEDVKLSGWRKKAYKKPIKGKK